MQAQLENQFPKLLDLDWVCNPVRGRFVEVQTRYVSFGSRSKALASSAARLHTPPPRRAPDHQCFPDRLAELDHCVFHHAPHRRHRLPRPQSSGESCTRCVSGVIFTCRSSIRCCCPRMKRTVMSWSQVPTRCPKSKTSSCTMRT